MNLNILIAIDSFKGCLSSKKAGQMVAAGLHSVDSRVRTNIIQIADGGEGSAEAIHARYKGKWITAHVQDPLHQLITAKFLLTDIDGLQTAVIESADCLGINLVDQQPSVVERSSSYGLGMLIDKALHCGAKQIIVMLGGTAVTDGGLGMLQALGARIYDSEKKELSVRTNPLFAFASMDMAPAVRRLNSIKLIAASDVTNPFCGEKGAATVFASQKGASPKQIWQLDKKLSDMVKWASKADFSQKPGSGAAGGIGGACLLLGGSIHAGFPLISRLIHLSEAIQQADIVFTGEGCLDGQSNYGKVPFCIATLCNHYQVPVIALAGKREVHLGKLDHLLDASFSIQLGPSSLETAIACAEENLKVVAAQVFRCLSIFNK
ncbi:MAG: glycerate kinase [Sporolactobacillus sp.]|jgi:glycerate kinase|nr:glycerate kinase [Sporolactobacillus sp.]